MNCSEANIFCDESNLILIPLIIELFQFNIFNSIVYFLAIIYIFYGIAIISDIFMESIDKITSTTRKVKKWSMETQKMEIIEVPIWNKTVANISLMAMGNSAANVLLAMMEVYGNGFTSGQLGPSSIVGAAALTLFVTTGMCIVSPANFQSKRIKRVKPYIVNAVTNLFAYIWIYIMLELITPGFIDIPEAAVTILFFPIFVIMGWMADRDFFMKTDSDFLSKKKLTKKSVRRFIERARSKVSLSQEECKELATYYAFTHQEHSSLFYRVNTGRVITGRKSLIPELSDRLNVVFRAIENNELNTDYNKKKSIPNIANIAKKVDFPVDIRVIYDESIVQFETDSRCVSCENQIDIQIQRNGMLTNSFICEIQTIDRTAIAYLDYKPVKETLTFESMQTSKTISIDILSNNKLAFENKFFLVTLSLPKEETKAKTGDINIMHVNIGEDNSDNYEDITVEFESRIILVSENEDKIRVPVCRSKEQEEREVVIKWKTIDGSAKHGEHFIGGNGGVLFRQDVFVEYIELPLISNSVTKKCVYFDVVLTDSANAGVKYGTTNKINVVIAKSENYEKEMKVIQRRLNNKTNIWDEWKKQIKQSLHFGNDQSDGKEPSLMAYTNHLICFGWKFFFAFMPPMSLWGGYPTFFLSIFWIGVTATIMGDLCTEFGCLVGISAMITGNTLVSLGTTLSNVFSSMIAARMDQYADNAICNSCGSNAINVFLGLGLAWLPAAIYQNFHGNQLYVSSDQLGFSVIVLTVFSLIFFGVLFARRHLTVFGRGELGGPKHMTILTCAVFNIMWIIYVVLVIIYP